MSNPNEVTTPEAEAAESLLLTLNGNSYSLIDQELPARKNKDGSTRPASFFLRPQLVGLGATIAFATDVLTEAEAANPGKGASAVIDEIVHSRAREASALAIKTESLDVDLGKYKAEFVSTAVARGDSLKALTETENKLTRESMAVYRFLLAEDNLRKADPSHETNWAEASAKLGRQFSEEDQVLLYISDLEHRLEDVKAKILKKEEAAEKAAKTKAAKTKAAPAAPAAPASAPEPDVAH
jgi:hypothetical protein